MCCSSSSILAQAQQDAYHNAIDNINCATIKMLLIGFDRPGAASKIKKCRFDEIINEVKQIKENQVKGYRQDILNVADNIEGYKDDIENPGEYVLYENALDEAGVYAISQFKKVCGTYQAKSSSICENMDRKILRLQGDINSYIDQALANISQHTYGGNKKSPAKKQTNQATAKEENKEDTKQQVASQKTKKEEALPVSGDIDEKSKTEKSRGGGLSWLTRLFLLAMLLGMGYLYFQNRKLKEQIEDVRMLIKMLTQKK